MPPSGEVCSISWRGSRPVAGSRRTGNEYAAEHGVAAESPPSPSLGPLAALARLAAERPTVRHRKGLSRRKVRMRVLNTKFWAKQRSKGWRHFVFVTGIFQVALPAVTLWLLFVWWWAHRAGLIEQVNFRQRF